MLFLRYRGVGGLLLSSPCDVMYIKVQDVGLTGQSVQVAGLPLEPLPEPVGQRTISIVVAYCSYRVVTSIRSTVHKYAIGLCFELSPLPCTKIPGPLVWTMVAIVFVKDHNALKLSKCHSQLVTSKPIRPMLPCITVQRY